MSRILTSIHGKKLGIDHDGRLLAPGGIVIGNHGSQRGIGGPDYACLFEDWLTNIDTENWVFFEGTDAATSTAATVSGSAGGVLNMVTGDAGTGIAADANQLVQNKALWSAGSGFMAFEARVRLSAITTCYVFVGLTDKVTGLESPIASAASGDNIATTATDAVGFMFDTNMATDRWFATGVANDVDAVHQDTGFAPVPDTYEVLRIEVDGSGNAVFYRNGTQVGTRMTSAVTASSVLTPTLFVSKRSVAATMTLSCDYISLDMKR